MKTRKYGPSKHIKTLQRRLAHLESRVHESRKRHKNLTFDISEIHALKHALNTMLLCKELRNDPETPQEVREQLLALEAFEAIDQKTTKD